MLQGIEIICSSDSNEVLHQRLVRCFTEELHLSKCRRRTALRSESEKDKTVEGLKTDE